MDSFITENPLHRLYSTLGILTQNKSYRRPPVVLKNPEKPYQLLLPVTRNFSALSLKNIDQFRK
jgi:hypothetical protein